MSKDTQTRRHVFAALGSAAGAAGLVSPALVRAAPAPAATMSDAERANLKTVSEFCAAWTTHDLPAIMAFFSANPSYRQTETQPATVGRDAVSKKIESFLASVVRFEVLDSWARGPIVVNERTDYFTGRLKSWQGVGVFLLDKGKIAEWYDYTIELKLN